MDNVWKRIERHENVEKAICYMKNNNLVEISLGIFNADNYYVHNAYT